MRSTNQKTYSVPAIANILNISERHARHLSQQYRKAFHQDYVDEKGLEIIRAAQLRVQQKQHNSYREAFLELYKQRTMSNVIIPLPPEKLVELLEQIPVMLMQLKQLHERFSHNEQRLSQLEAQLKEIAERLGPSAQAANEEKSQPRFFMLR